MQPIFRHFHRDEFERQYSARLLVRDSEALVATWTERSQRYRSDARCWLDVPYGPRPRARCDIFCRERGRDENTPVLVYIHGGYWRSRNKSSYSYVARPLVRAGATVVIAGYSLCPDVTLPDIVEEMRDLIRWLWDHIGEYGGDRNNIHLCGNSAGGHLTTMLAATEWSLLGDGLSDALIKSAMSLSGLFELSPLLLHSVNEVLQLDANTARRMSPQRLTPQLAGPLTVAVGGDESEEFIRQSEEFASAWRDLGAECEFVLLDGLNHFTITDRLDDDDYAMTRRLLTRMGLD